MQEARDPEAEAVPNEFEAEEKRIEQPAMPPVTLALILVNLLMALVQFVGSGMRWDNPEMLASQPINWALGAKVPSLVADGDYWRLVTANFLHGSWMHLAFNMLGLLLFGRYLEPFFGSPRTLVIYVLSCVSGAAASYVFSPSVSLGASTGVLGLVGALVVHHWRYRQFLPERVKSGFPLLILMVLFQFTMDFTNSSVDIYGHLGGFLGGAVLARLLESRISGPLQEEREWLPLPTALLTAVALLGYGAYGLTESLSKSTDLLRVGRARDNEARITYLRRVVEQRPNFWEGHRYLLGLYVQEQEFDAALQQFAVLRQAPPPWRDLMTDSRMTVRLAEQLLQDGMAAYARGDWHEALRQTERCLQLNPPAVIRAAAANTYAWILVDKLNRDYRTAERYALEASQYVSKTGPEPPYLDTLAWVYYKQDRLERALRLQLRAVELARRALPGPEANAPQVKQYREGLAEMLYHLGMIYAAQGNAEQARDSFEEALRTVPDYPAAVQGLEQLQREKGRDELRASPR